MNSEETRAPRVFLSYAWESEDHKLWVKNLAARLRANGVDATLDQWHLVPGDQLPAFMEKAVRENDYVLLICTPTYKKKSDGRLGGVGYEGDIITGEVHQTQNHRKFIPILRAGSWHEAAPSWLLGKVFIDLSDEPYTGAQYEELLGTILRTREVAPPLGRSRSVGTENRLMGVDHGIAMSRLYERLAEILEGLGWSRRLNRDEKNGAIYHHAGSDSIGGYLGGMVRADRGVTLEKGVFLEFMKDHGKDQGFVRFGPKSTSISAHVNPPDDDRLVSRWSYRGHNPLLDLAVSRDRSDRAIYALVDEYFLSEYSSSREIQRSLLVPNLPIVFINTLSPALISVSGGAS